MTDVVHNFRKFNTNLYNSARFVMWCGLVFDAVDHDQYTRDNSGNCEECLSALALDMLARVP